MGLTGVSRLGSVGVSLLSGTGAILEGGGGGGGGVSGRIVRFESSVLIAPIVALERVVRTDYAWLAAAALSGKPWRTEGGSVGRLPNVASVSRMLSIALRAFTMRPSASTSRT